MIFRWNDNRLIIRQIMISCLRTENSKLKLSSKHPNKFEQKDRLHFLISFKGKVLWELEWDTPKTTK